jgi:flagellar hook-length control protein FliK
LPPTGNLLPDNDIEVADVEIGAEAGIDVELDAELGANGQLDETLAGALAPTPPLVENGSPLIATLPGQVAGSATPQPSAEVLPVLAPAPRPAALVAVPTPAVAARETAGDGKPLPITPGAPASVLTPPVEPLQQPPGNALPLAAVPSPDPLRPAAERRGSASNTFSLEGLADPDKSSAGIKVQSGPETTGADAWRELRPQPTQTASPVPITVAAAAQAGQTPSTDALPAQLAAAINAQAGATPTRVGAEPSMAAPSLSQSIATSVTDPAWGDQLGQRVQLMASNRLQSAEIRLTPAELGPLRIQLSIDDGAANVTFHAQHAVTRDAIEQALPRLRDMLADNGLTLNQVSIGEQGVQHGGRDARDTAPEPHLATTGAPAENEVEHRDERPAAGRPGNSLVDTFA